MIFHSTPIHHHSTFFSPFRTDQTRSPTRAKSFYYSVEPPPPPRSRRVYVSRVFDHAACVFPGGRQTDRPKPVHAIASENLTRGRRKTNYEKNDVIGRPRFHVTPLLDAGRRGFRDADSGGQLSVSRSYDGVAGRRLCRPSRPRTARAAAAPFCPVSSSDGFPFGRWREKHDSLTRYRRAPSVRLRLARRRREATRRRFTRVQRLERLFEVLRGAKTVVLQ